MKKISALVLLAFVSNLAFSQTNQNRNAAFHFSFVTPIGTNGLNSAKTTNTVSLNLLVGVSQNEEAFTLGGLSNVILNNAKGLQIAGLSNYIGNEGLGCQIAGLTNINKGDLRGLQLAGLVNTAANSKGGQVAGLVNASKELKGLQFAGLANIATDIKGGQFAGLINIAKDVNGGQFAGLINIAKDVKGVQVAGIINIAENSDVPIGLINIIKNGEMGVAVTYDGIGNIMASFRSGGKYTYGIVGVGYNHKLKDGFVNEYGLGAHIPVNKWFRINNELKVTTIGYFSDEQSKTIFNAGYSLLPAFKIGQHIELFGGASINYLTTQNMTAENILPNQSLWKNHTTTKIQQVYIGYQIGVQLIF